MAEPVSLVATIGYYVLYAAVEAPKRESPGFLLQTAKELLTRHLEGWPAVRRCPDLGPEELARIVQVMRGSLAYAMGALEAAVRAPTDEGEALRPLVDAVSRLVEAATVEWASPEAMAVPPAVASLPADGPITPHPLPSRQTLTAITDRILGVKFVWGGRRSKDGVRLRGVVLVAVARAGGDLRGGIYLEARREADAGAWT